jgi:hypothetical protein
LFIFPAVTRFVAAVGAWIDGEPSFPYKRSDLDPMAGRLERTMDDRGLMPQAFPCSETSVRRRSRNKNARVLSLKTLANF